MSEILSLTLFWIFLYVVANGLIVFGWKEKFFAMPILAFVISWVGIVHTMNLSYTSSATNWVMIGLWIITLCASIFAVLSALPDLLKK